MNCDLIQPNVNKPIEIVYSNQCLKGKILEIQFVNKIVVFEKLDKKTIFIDTNHIASIEIL